MSHSGSLPPSSEAQTRRMPDRMEAGSMLGRYTIEGAEGEPVPLPTAVQAGGSYGLPLGSNLALRAALEARATRGRNAIGLAGLELTAPAAGAALRLGWRMNDDAASMSVGAGYELHALRFDYAFVPYTSDGLDLGDTHRLSLSARF